jgi:hypothetical protein
MTYSFMTAVKSRFAFALILLGLVPGPASATGTLDASITLDPVPALCSAAAGPVTVTGNIDLSVTHLVQGLTPVAPADAGASVSVGIYANGALVDSFPANLNGNQFLADVSFSPVDGVSCFDIIADLTYNFDPVGETAEDGGTKWEMASSGSDGLVPGQDNDVCFGVDDCPQTTGGGISDGTGAYDAAKTCTVQPATDGLNHELTCQIVVDHPAAVMMPFGDPPAPPQFSVIDRLTMNGQPIPGVITTATASTGATLQNCANGQYMLGGFLGMPTGPLPMTQGYGCSVTAAPATVQTTVTVTALIPLDVSGPAQNCASTLHGIPILPDALIPSAPSCVDIDLPQRNPIDPLPIAPKQCEVFTPEVTCNEVTGKPVVTLKNKYAKLFSPKSVSITSLTPGVTVQQSKANALSVQLTGANPGDTISLSTEAVEKGAGSEPGLDLCCMGEIEVKIPEGFVCEAKQVLDVSKTCDTGVNPAIDTDAECEITVHYEGPPPPANNPIKIVEAVSGAPWAFTTTPLSGDNWNCPAVADATPFTCSISSADEPTANWQNWTSTLIVQMSVGETFENCVTATAAGGLEDKVCWSTEMPELTIEKLADQEQCVVGEPCTFTITVSNPSGTDYSGPITLNDQIAGANPPLLADSGSFVAVSPALCDPTDLQSGICTGQASIPAGGSQSYTVTWLPPMLTMGAEAALVTNCVEGASANGPMTVANAPDGSFGEPAFAAGQSCANVGLLPPNLTIAKTGPDVCVPGGACDYQVSISSGGQPVNAPVMLMDDAPSGFVITGISPTPPGCGANLPANPLACVVPVNLNPFETQTYTISMQAVDEAEMTEPYSAENCAGLWSVPPGTDPADYSFDSFGPEFIYPDGFEALMEAASVTSYACAPVNWQPDTVDGPEVTIEKVCEPVTPLDSPDVEYSTTCTITVITNGPIQTYLTVTDDLTGAGQVVAISSNTPGWTCAAGQCEIEGSNLDQTSSVSTFNIAVEFPPSDGVAATNCGILAFDAHEHARSCVDITVNEEDSGPATLSVEKTCGEAIVLNETGLAGAECTITVTGSGDLPDQIEIHETMLSYAGASHSGGTSPLNIVTMTSAENWQFPALPSAQATTAGGAAAPAIATLTSAELLAAGGQSTITVGVQFQDVGWAMESQNCVQAFGTGAAGNPLDPVMASENVCVPFEGPLDLPDVLQIEKTCSPSPEQGDADMDRIPDTLTCQITVIVPPGYNGGLIVLEDFVQDQAQSPATVATITSVTSADPWDCSIVGQLTSPSAEYCTILSGDMPGGTSTLTVTMADDPNPATGPYFNCVRHTDVAGAGFAQTGFSCAPITYPAGGNKVTQTPNLTVTKTAAAPCAPDVAAQTYACGFDLTVSNTGGAAFAGPMVLGDAFDVGMVTAVSGTGTGWSCNLAGDAASCINGNLGLAPGASSVVSLDVTVKGLPEGGTFQNCAGIGASDDPTEQAVIVQTALTLMGVDIGPVDGKPGKRTRAAVADLQKQLGLAATGDIDQELLAVLGVPVATNAETSCVTVDLPPMPRPPLQCDKATTKLVDGSCVCRYKSMYQADKTSCGCVKGTTFVAGEGCLKIRDKAPNKIKTPACDPETTVLRDGKCECREKGMERVSKTACALPKKKRDLKICPNGLPEIPGVGCVDIELKLKRKEKDIVKDEDKGDLVCNPEVQECR